MLTVEQPRDIYTRTVKDIAALLQLTERGVQKAIVIHGCIRGVRISYQRNEGRSAPILISERSFIRLQEKISRG